MWNCACLCVLFLNETAKCKEPTMTSLFLCICSSHPRYCRLSFSENMSSFLPFVQWRVSSSIPQNANSPSLFSFMPFYRLISPLLSLCFLPTISPLSTSSRWGNQPACYSLISDTIRLLILAPVSQCRGQSCHISPAGELSLRAALRNHEQMLTGLFHSYCHKQTDCRSTDSHTDRFSFVQKSKLRQLEFDVVLWLHRKSAIRVKLWSTIDENIIWLPHGWRVLV